MIGLTDRPLADQFGKRFDLGAAVSAVEWIGGQAWFACGDGVVRRLSADGTSADIAVHDGAILCAAPGPDRRSLLTGGDDGRVVRVAADSTTEELGHFGRHWVDHIIASPQSGVIVAAVGKEAVVWKSGHRQPSHRYAFASTIGGIALDAKGKRLAVTGYGGATLLYASAADSARTILDWRGSHLQCTLSPDGAFLVSAMQETGLHGWKLPDKTDLAMSGYHGKTKSFSWSKRGKWLATGGHFSIVIWPFQGKNGPMGGRAVTLGASSALVTRVAFNPQIDVLAAGYADGSVNLLRLDDEGFASVEIAGGSAISALSWRDDGAVLAWGAEDGRTGLLDMARLP